MCLLDERDFPVITGQPVEIGAVKRGETFQLVQCSGRLEGFRVEFHGGMRRVDAGAAAGGFLAGARVRGAVGPQEKFRVAAGRGAQQGMAVAFPLQHRQAIMMGADTARQHVIAIEQQVMGGDGGGDSRRRRRNVIHRLAAGQVVAGTAATAVR